MTSVLNPLLQSNGSKPKCMKKSFVCFFKIVLFTGCFLYLPSVVFGQVKSKEAIPSGASQGVTFDLNQNNTNTTNIKYYLKNATEVRLKIYNLLGKEVATIVNQKQHAGHHSIVYNGAGLSEGVYYYQISIDGVMETKRMIISK